jgi:hypothetical protein
MGTSLRNGPRSDLQEQFFESFLLAIGGDIGDAHSDELLWQFAQFLVVTLVGPPCSYGAAAGPSVPAHDGEKRLILGQNLDPDHRMAHDLASHFIDRTADHRPALFQNADGVARALVESPYLFKLRRIDLMANPFSKDARAIQAIRSRFGERAMV